MITIPDQIVKQLPCNPHKYPLLIHLHREFGGLPLPLSQEALGEALELVDGINASPVFNDDEKAAVQVWRAALMEHADDWFKMRDAVGPTSPIYRVLLDMQQEIQSLRTALNTAQTRLNAMDDARLNHARRVLGLPPARGLGTKSNERSVPGTPQPFSNPSSIQRLSADRLRDSLEKYLDESPPFDASRDQLVRALKVCCGMEEQ